MRQFGGCYVSCSVFLLLHATSLLGIARGDMSTLAPMWGSFQPRDSYAVCVLQASTLKPSCLGTFSILNNTSPPANVSLWALSAGGSFTCGLQFESKYPICWGQIPGSQIPSDYQRISYSEISAGGWHACAVRNGSGQLDCWGNNDSNQLEPPNGVDFMKVTSGDHFTCGLSRTTSRAICWGQITTENSTVPDPEAMFDDIFAGRVFICGIEKGTRRTLCWGANNKMQSQPPKDVKFLAISAGTYHSCGLRDDTREVVCWGDNSQLQQEIPRGVRFSTIEAGDWYTCGVRLDEKTKVICWGSYSGNLGGISVNGGLCVSRCKSGTYQDVTSSLCPSMNEKVCLDCSHACRNGTFESSSCGGTSDRVCKPCLSGICGTSAFLPSTPPPKKKPFPTGTVIASVLGASGILVALLGVLVVYRKRILNALKDDHASGDTWDSHANRVASFSRAELRSATRNYSEEMVLGKGSFGKVHKGILPNGQAIAIKKATEASRAASSFDMELELLARIHHMYLVNLVGYCKEDRSLVFEFMENGSLYDCLFKKRNVRLDLVTRVRVAAQAARGLEYLHTYASPQIIHRDVKSSNILLDGDWNAHVSDFGLSLFGPASNASHLSNMTVVGTPGYVDPEYFQSMQVTSKSDVYSFGVVLLELLTGQKAVNEHRSIQGLVSWVVEQDSVNEVVDVALKTSSNHEILEEILRLALECTSLKGKERPKMVLVASALEELLQRMIAASSEAPSSSSNPSF